MYSYFTDDAIESQKDGVIFPLVFRRRARNTTALGTGRNWRGGKWEGEEVETRVLETTRGVLLSKLQFLGPPPGLS